MQEAALGGLKPSTRRMLVQVAADASARRPIQVAPAPALKPGTMLLRNWHGTEHRVIVREHGVEFQGDSIIPCLKPRTGSPAASGRGGCSSGSRGRLRSMPMANSKSQARRCAIYTRKSSEEGLEQDFNALQAQREACEAFIRSQASEGWTELLKAALEPSGVPPLPRPVQPTTRPYAVQAARDSGRKDDEASQLR